MNWRSRELQELLQRDSALASRLLQWESCGLYVRMYLLARRLEWTARTAVRRLAPPERRQ